MKLKTRLVIGFMIIIIIPVLCSLTIVGAFSQMQIRNIEKNYGVTANYQSLTNPISMLHKVTENLHHQLVITAARAPEQLEDQEYLDSVNDNLKDMNSYLIVRCADEIIYADEKGNEAIYKQLPEYGNANEENENGTYVGGNLQILIKQVDFVDREGSQCSIFIITDVSQAIPEVSKLVGDTLVGIVVILVLTATALILWIYRGVVEPLNRMKIATQNIKDGNLDFELEVETDDEIGQLCRDFEEMRLPSCGNEGKHVEYPIVAFCANPS